MSQGLRGLSEEEQDFQSMTPVLCAQHAQLKYAAVYHSYNLKCMSQVPPDNYRKSTKQSKIYVVFERNYRHALKLIAKVYCVAFNMDSQLLSSVRFKKGA